MMCLTTTPNRIKYYQLIYDRSSEMKFVWVSFSFLCYISIFIIYDEKIV